MGPFPSPAKDYIEARPTIESLCNITLSSRVLPTSNGWVVIEPVHGAVGEGKPILIEVAGRLQFAVRRGQSLITDDGEALEGDVLDDTKVIGRVSYQITRTWEDDYPVM